MDEASVRGHLRGLARGKVLRGAEDGRRTTLFRGKLSSQKTTQSCLAETGKSQLCSAERGKHSEVFGRLVFAGSALLGDTAVPLLLRVLLLQKAPGFFWGMKLHGRTVREVRPVLVATYPFLEWYSV